MASRIVPSAATRQAWRRSVTRGRPSRPAPTSGRAGLPTTVTPGRHVGDDDGAHADRGAVADRRCGRGRAAPMPTVTSDPMRAPPPTTAPGPTCTNVADADVVLDDGARVDDGVGADARPGVDDGPGQHDGPGGQVGAGRDPGRGVDDDGPAAPRPRAPRRPARRAGGRPDRRRRRPRGPGRGGHRVGVVANGARPDRVIAEVRRTASDRARAESGRGSVKPTRRQPRRDPWRAASATTRACSPPPISSSGRAVTAPAGSAACVGGLGGCHAAMISAILAPARPSASAGRAVRRASRGRPASGLAERVGDGGGIGGRVEHVAPRDRRPAWRPPTLTAGRPTAGASTSALEQLPSIASATRSRPQ